MPGRLGRRIRDVRKERGLTQEELAERADVTWHFISAIERGTSGLALDTLIAIAAALEVSVSELFAGVDRPLPKETKRLLAALSTQSADTQRRILRIVDEALQLRG